MKHCRRGYGQNEKQKENDEKTKRETSNFLMESLDDILMNEQLLISAERKKGEPINFDQFSHLVTSGGEMSNFLLEDLERVLQLEMIEKYEVSIKLEV